MYAEGRAKLYDKGAFINSEAKLTRDISVALVASKPTSKILDPTAATGIRGIRYMLEGGASDATFLEINETAYHTLEKNLGLNGIGGTALNTSVQEFTASSRGKFDVIDLDPFGGIQPYVYDLMKVAHSGSLFFATATDTAVLCGAHRNACLRLYGSVPLHNELCQEAGLRIMIGYIARTAAPFDYGIRPLISMVYKHYMRTHLELAHGAKQANASLKEMGFVGYCGVCGYRGVQHGFIPNELQCPECGAKLELAGPLWLGKLKDADTAGMVEKRIVADGASKAEVDAFNRIKNELDMPFYYSVPKATKRLGISSVSHYAVIGRLKAAGFEASATHFDTSSIKTDAGIKEFKACVEEAHNGK